MAGIFKKIIKGVLIGGGTVLSLLSPAAGGAVISAGMAIGAGAVAAGSLIKTNSTSIDRTTNTINTVLENSGLMEPAIYPSRDGAGIAITQKSIVPILLIGGLGLFIVVSIFKKRR